jgi:hypothetical protein
MNRLMVAVSLVGGVVLMGCGSSGSSSGQRHLKAKLEYTRTASASYGGVSAPKPRALDVIRAGMKAKAYTRAQRSPAFAKALARHFTRMGAVPGQTDRLLAQARATGKHPLDVAFDEDVAAFVWDDEHGTWLDSVYLDPETGYFDAVAPYDTPVSLWVGTYDAVAMDAAIVAPWTYDFNYEFPPGEADVVWDYDGYFWAPGETVVVDGGYEAWTSDQSGYYQLDWYNADGSAGVGWFYMLPDNPDYGSYWMIWDDGTCTQGVQVYISFDAYGEYFSVNGVDGPMSLSGLVTEVGYLSGNGRWTVVGEDGLNYQVEVAISYLGAAPGAIDYVCPADTIVLPPDPVCPVGCSLDAYFNICVIDGTLDPVSYVGLSCDLYDGLGVVIECPLGCTLDAVDGFCYDDVEGWICY